MTTEKRMGNNNDLSQGNEPITQLANIFPTDRTSADLFRNSLQRFDFPVSDAVKKLFDRDNKFKIVDEKAIENKDNKVTKDNKENKDDKAGKPADKGGTGAKAETEKRTDVKVGQVADIVSPKGFDKVDQKKVDKEFDSANSKNKNIVLQHSDKDKKDAKVQITQFGYFDQQPEAVKNYNDFLNSVKKEDLGKPIELNDKQMEQVYPVMPNGLDFRPQTDHKFSVQEIDGRRVLVTESKIQSPDGNPKNEKMKLTVYANPDEKKQTMDVISFEASSHDKKKAGDNNYATLKPEAMKAINSIKWSKDNNAPGDKKDDKPEGKKEEKKEDKPESKKEEKKEDKPESKKEEKKEDKPESKKEEKKEDKPESKKEEKKEDKPESKKEEKKEDKPESKKEEKKEETTTQQKGDRTLVLNQDKAVVEVRGQDGKPIAKLGDKVGDEKVTSLKYDEASRTVIAGTDKGNFVATGPSGEQVKYTEQKLNNGNTLRQFDQPADSFVVLGQDGKSVKSAQLNGNPVKIDAKTNSLTEQVGDKTVVRDSNLNITAVQGKNGEALAKVGTEPGDARSIKVDEKTKAVTADMGDGKSKLITAGGLETTVGKDGKAIELSSGKDKWSIKDGVATRTVDGKAPSDGKPSVLKDASIDAVTGNITGKGEIIGANRQKETAQITVKPNGSWSEQRTGRDAAGTSYNFTIDRDKSGVPTRVEHPVVKDGKVVPGTSRTLDYQFQKENGEIALKDGKPTIERVDITTKEQGKNDEKRSLIKQADGQWRLTEPVLDYSTKQIKDVDAPGADGKPKQQIWKADPIVGADGSLVNKQQDKTKHVYNPGGDQQTVNVGAAPKTEQEKKDANDRTKIFSIHEDANKKNVWAQGVPSVINQWGFDAKDNGKQVPSERSRDPHNPKWEKQMGDQGYPYWRKQEVDAQGIKSRDTWFGKEGGVRIPYVGPDGQMSTLKNVQRMTSERQDDGSYKITYRGADGKPVKTADGKPAVFNTTADGRYMTDTGIPVQDQPVKKPPASDNTQTKASDTTAKPADPTAKPADTTVKPAEPAVKIDSTTNLQGLENMARSIDINKDPKGADQIARAILDAKIKAENEKVTQALQQNDTKAVREHSLNIYKMQYMNETEGRRREYIQANYGKKSK